MLLPHLNNSVDQLRLRPIQADDVHAFQQLTEVSYVFFRKIREGQKLNVTQD